MKTNALKNALKNNQFDYIMEVQEEMKKQVDQKKK